MMTWLASCPSNFEVRFRRAKHMYCEVGMDSLDLVDFRLAQISPTTANEAPSCLGFVLSCELLRRSSYCSLAASLSCVDFWEQQGWSRDRQAWMLARMEGYHRVGDLLQVRRTGLLRIDR